MAETFDAYYRWLAIPSNEQPPHHYRLLSLQQFESEPDVIESAADRQMAHVRSFQNSKHAEASQRLLNEIAAARVALLDPEMKAAYDQQLRAKLASTQPKRALAVAKPLTEPAPVQSAPIQPVVRTAPRPVHKSGSPLPFILGGVVGLGVMLGVGWFVLQAMQAPADQPIAKSNAVDSEPDDDSPAATRPAPVPAKLPTSSEKPPATPVIKTPVIDPLVRTGPVETGTLPELTSPAVENRPIPPLTPITSDPPSTASPPPVTTQDPVDQPLVQEEPPARLPVPEKELRDQKRAEIMQIFPLAEAKTVEARAELAEKLLQTAQDTQEDAAAQFALLNLAREQAVLAGDLETAFAAIDLLATNFAFDPATVRVLSLEEAAKAGIPAAEKQPIVERGMEMVDQFVAENEFDKATALADRLLAIARPLGNAKLTKSVVDQRRTTQETGVAFVAVKDAWQTLQASPDDPAANLAVGRYLTFIRQDWKQGLVHLAAGNHQPLAKAAQAELAKPNSTDAVEQLAAAWWNAGEAETDAQAKDLCQARSGMWYRRIVGQLAGLQKATAEQRIGETAELPVVLPASDSGPNGGPDGKSDGPTIDVRSYSALRRQTPAMMHIMNAVNNAEICINGKLVASAGKLASQFPCKIQLGDVITAKLTPVAHSPSFAMVMQLASGHAVVPTNRQTWFIYKPADPANWSQLPDDPPKTPSLRANQHARPVQANGTACETIWGDYVYHIVNEDDLYEQARPIAERKRERGMVPGVLSVSVRSNESCVYINNWFVAYNCRINASTETPVLLAPGDMILAKGVLGAHGPSVAMLFRSTDGKHTFVTNQGNWRQFKPTHPLHWWRQPELTGAPVELKKDPVYPLPAGSVGLGCEAIWGDFIYYIVQEEDLK